jgi:hypothetical protein
LCLRVDESPYSDNSPNHRLPNHRLPNHAAQSSLAQSSLGKGELNTKDPIFNTVSVLKHEKPFET